jgi:hypothetical protein
LLQGTLLQYPPELGELGVPRYTASELFANQSILRFKIACEPKLFLGYPPQRRGTEDYMSMSITIRLIRYQVRFAFRGRLRTKIIPGYLSQLTEVEGKGKTQTQAT